jgi:hypothetical protein
LTRRAWGLGLAAGLVAPALGQAGLVRQPRPAALGAPTGSVPVGAAIDHPQGLEVSADGRTLWITSVVRARRAGLLIECEAETGALRRSMDVHVGDCYHPGGFSRTGDRLWVPVAEYRRASRSLVQCRDVGTLALVSTFEVADHIGCLAADGTRLVGANWDARTFYEWAPDGREVVRRENPQAAGYQDMKWVDGRLIAGGLLENTGVIDVLEWPSLTLLSRLEVGRTDRDVLYTHEGLAVTEDRVLVVPEDDPARVFAFPRPQAI